jgi:hypothetical protein
LDAFRIINHVDGFKVEVVSKADVTASGAHRLFFINLGAYQSNVFEELHHKMVVVADAKATAIKKAKQSDFFKRYASPHVDDKYGVDVDEVFEIEDVLPAAMKTSYQLVFTPANDLPEDELVLGYMPIHKL